MWDTAKVLLYGTFFCVLHAFIRKRDIFRKTPPQEARGKKSKTNPKLENEIKIQAEITLKQEKLTEIKT